MPSTRSALGIWRERGNPPKGEEEGEEEEEEEEEEEGEEEGRKLPLYTLRHTHSLYFPKFYTSINCNVTHAHIL